MRIRGRCSFIRCCTAADSSIPDIYKKERDEAGQEEAAEEDEKETADEEG